MWDSAFKQALQGEVTEAMRLLLPNLEAIHFLSSEGSSELEEGILLATSEFSMRTPLGSHGEGMRRLMMMSLSLLESRGGVLLVDEIDTGLHYSILGDVWRLVIETAIKHDVQVFATTHSYDCIRGLSWLCESYPHLAQEVSLQKIEPTLERSVSLRADQIIFAFEHSMEMR